MKNGSPPNNYFNLKELTIQDIETIVHRDENRVMEAKEMTGEGDAVEVLYKDKKKKLLSLSDDMFIKK